MNIYFIIGGSFFLVLSLSLGLFLSLKNKRTSDQGLTSQRHAPTKNISSDSSQFKALVSASRVSASFERSEITKEKGLEYVADLNNLKSIKNSLFRDLDFLDHLIKSENSFLWPVASGKAAKLQFVGTKFSSVVSSRYDQALSLSRSENPNSYEVQKIIHEPYVVKFDVYNDLVGENSGESVDWQDLLAWVSNFSEEVSQVKKLLEKKARAV
jgi:hypothetical protein